MLTHAQADTQTCHSPGSTITQIQHTYMLDDYSDSEHIHARQSLRFSTHTCSTITQIQHTYMLDNYSDLAHIHALQLFRFSSHTCIHTYIHTYTPVCVCVCVCTCKVYPAFGQHAKPVSGASGKESFRLSTAMQTWSVCMCIRMCV